MGILDATEFCRVAIWNGMEYVIALTNFYFTVDQDRKDPLDNILPRLSPWEPPQANT